MDKFCPISSSEQHQEDQLGFHNTISIPTFEFQPPQYQQQYIIQQNHALANSLNMDTFLNYTSSSFGHGGAEFHHATTFDDNNLGNKMQDLIWPSSALGNADFDNENKLKKSVHKEIERQRRYQMSNLYASLKSLIPHESTKARQTTSELIQAAENHIKVEQKNIEELTIQRDKLIKKCAINNTQYNNINSSINNGSSSPLACNYLPVDISVRSYLGGMEILISIDLRIMDGFQLSRVLDLVLSEGLSVVSYVSTRVNGKMLHTIQTEVCHLEVTDAYDLKQKLVDIII